MSSGLEVSTRFMARARVALTEEEYKKLKSLALRVVELRLRGTH